MSITSELQAPSSSTGTLLAGPAFGTVPISKAGIFSSPDGSIHCTRSQTFSYGCEHSEQISNPSLTSVGGAEGQCKTVAEPGRVGICWLCKLQICSYRVMLESLNLGEKGSLSTTSAKLGFTMPDHSLGPRSHLQ